MPNRYPFWLDVLASEISGSSGESVTRETLAKQFRAFRESCRDPLLRQSYPPDMHHFKRSARPQASTRDIILSFMDAEYPKLAVPIIAELAARLEKEAAKDRSSSELEKILVKERVRRYATGRKGTTTYWGANRRRLQEKYVGIYALLRIDSGGHLQSEPFAIALKPRDPTRVSVYWLCEEHGRVGDLLVNTYRFSGLTVRKSTDAVIEPVSISLLRAPRRRVDGDVPPLVLGGFVVGWKDNDYAALFHSRVALIKLEAFHHSVSNYLDFMEIACREQVSEVIEALGRLSVVRQHLIPKFLERTEPAMTQTEASDALPNLEASMTFVSGSMRSN